MATVSMRVDQELVDELGRVEAMSHQKRADVLREALADGLASKRLALALESYQRRETSLGRSAELAGVPLVRFVEHLRDHGTLFQYGEQDLADDLAWA